MDRVTRNVFWYIIAGIITIYIAAFQLLHINVLNEVLNGLFMGISATVTFVFRRQVVRLGWTRERFNDVRMLTLSIFLGGISIALFCTASIINSINGLTLAPGTVELTTLGKYFAIIGGIGLILSPGYYSGYLHGESKRTVWAGIILGLVIAAFLSYIQISS